jgi:type II secretory pathway pseudopilin PulG
MIVVAIIGLLAALAIPTFIIARKQSQGRRIINDARQIDAAVGQWALEYGKKDGDLIATSDLSQVATYTKSGTIPTTDVLGFPYQIGPVGPTQVMVSATTKTALDGASIDWGPY